MHDDYAYFWPSDSSGEKRAVATRLRPDNGRTGGSGIESNEANLGSHHWIDLGRDERVRSREGFPVNGDGLDEAVGEDPRQLGNGSDNDSSLENKSQQEHIKCIKGSASRTLT